MRRRITRIGVGVIGLMLIVLGLLPARFDALANQVRVHAPSPPGPAARALMARTLVVDLHADSLLWRRDLLSEIPRGHVDYPRLVRGQVGLQIFSSVTKTPKNQNYERNSADTDNITLLAVAQLQPIRTWGSLLERSLYHAGKLQAAVNASNGKLLLVQTRSDLVELQATRRTNRAVVGALLSVEGLQNIEGKLANIDVLRAAGFRMLGLAHFFDNEVAGSVHGMQKYGLTALGRAVVARMEAGGMIVDVAHASHQTIADVLAIATRPVVFSHGGVKGTCNTNRNLTDAEIRGIARTGGIIGIGYWETAICDASARGVARAMSHVRNLVGAQYVALGSDFDGAVRTPFDTADVAQVAQALQEAGWPAADIEAAMGGNAVRVLMATLPVGR